MGEFKPGMEIPDEAIAEPWCGRWWPSDMQPEGWRERSFGIFGMALFFDIFGAGSQLKVWTFAKPEVTSCFFSSLPCVAAVSIGDLGWKLRFPQ